MHSMLLMHSMNVPPNNYLKVKQLHIIQCIRICWCCTYLLILAFSSCRPAAMASMPTTDFSNTWIQCICAFSNVCSANATAIWLAFWSVWIWRFSSTAIVVTSLCRWRCHRQKTICFSCEYEPAFHVHSTLEWAAAAFLAEATRCPHDVVPMQPVRRLAVQRHRRTSRPYLGICQTFSDLKFTWNLKKITQIVIKTPFRVDNNTNKMKRKQFHVNFVCSVTRRIWNSSNVDNYQFITVLYVTVENKNIFAVKFYLKIHVAQLLFTIKQFSNHLKPFWTEQYHAKHNFKCIFDFHISEAEKNEALIMYGATTTNNQKFAACGWLQLHSYWIRRVHSVDVPSSQCSLVLKSIFMERLRCVCTWACLNRITFEPT